MKTIKITLTFWCFLLFSSAVIFAEDNRSYKEERPAAEYFADCLEKMIQTGNPDEARNARSNWQRYCFALGAPNRQADKALAVKLMTEALLDDANENAHFWFLRQLGRLGDSTCVPTIAKFLDHNDRLIRDEALWALANIPNQETKNALRERLNREDNEERKIAVQNALDYVLKRDAATVRTLDEIVSVLEGSDKTAWDTALSQLAWLPNVKITDVPNWQERFERLSPEVQILLMDALTSAGDRSALPLALYLVKQYAPLLETDDPSENQSDEEKKQLEDQRIAREKVQLAGFRALGVLGDSTAKDVLLQNVRTRDSVWGTIRVSLGKLNYDGADQHLIDAVRRAEDNDTRNRVLEAISMRRAVCFIPLFQEFLSHKEGGTRHACVGGLEGIADASAIPALVNQFHRETEDQGLRERIENVIVSISVRVTDADGRGVVLCRAVNDKNDAEKADMLPMIGRVGGERAKELVLNFLNNGSEELKVAAFRALCNWPDAAVADDLYRFAKQGDNARTRQAARAYIRVVTLHEEGRSFEDSLELFKRAMDLAKTNEDRNLLLSRVNTVRSIEVFRFAARYLDDADLQQAACRAIVDMANDSPFHGQHREEINRVLDKVYNITNDNSHKERILRYKERK